MTARRRMSARSIGVAKSKDPEAVMSVARRIYVKYVANLYHLNDQSVTLLYPSIHPTQQALKENIRAIL